MRLPRLLPLLLAPVLLAACATIAPGRLDSFEIVDCELPGVILHIGTAHATTGRARAIRTSADDCALRGGYYTAADRANYETALRVWLPPAEDGDAQAQYHVGQIYEKGLGRAADPAKAAQWYRRAADQGHRAAMTALGTLYERGLVAGGTPTQALELYRRAAQIEAPLAYASDIQLREDEIAALRAELERSHAQAQEQQRDATRRQQALQAEATRLRRELERARAAADRERVAQLEQSLRATDRSLQGATSERASAEQAAQRTLGTGQFVRTAASGTSAAAGAPQIDLLEPTASTVRGLIAVRVRGGAASQRVRVRVRSQLALQDVRIGDSVVAADAQGEYALEVPFDGEATPIEIAATDVRGQRAVLPLLLARDTHSPKVQAVPEAPVRYHALIIGNARYRSWAPLDTPHHDAEDVATVLRERYGFETTVLLDATRAQIFRALAHLRSTLTENDNLLVYYSGHGSWDAGNLQGYWVPVDGDKDSVANYISSSDVTDQIGVMRARQILVVADACYSGVFVRAPDADEASDSALALQQRARIPSRKVMSSGNIREVLDAGRGNHSVFAAEFLDALRRHTGGPIEAQRLYAQIAPRVRSAAEGYGEQQEPQYGQLRFAGHVGGDFLFMPTTSRKSAARAPTTPARPMARSFPPGDPPRTEHAP